MPSIDAVDRSIELEIALEIRDSARRCVFSCVWVNSETDTRDRAKKQIESSKKHIESNRRRGCCMTRGCGCGCAVAARLATRLATRTTGGDTRTTGGGVGSAFQSLARNPPSTGKTTPVIHDAASLAKGDGAGDVLGRPGATERDRLAHDVLARIAVFFETFAHLGRHVSGGDDVDGDGQFSLLAICPASLRARWCAAALLASYENVGYF